MCGALRHRRRCSGGLHAGSGAAGRRAHHHVGAAVGALIAASSPAEMFCDPGGGSPSSPLWPIWSIYSRWNVSSLSAGPGAGRAHARLSGAKPSRWGHLQVVASKSSSGVFFFQVGVDVEGCRAARLAVAPPEAVGPDLGDGCGAGIGGGGIARGRFAPITGGRGAVELAPPQVALRSVRFSCGSIAIVGTSLSVYPPARRPKRWLRRRCPAPAEAAGWHRVARRTGLRSPSGGVVVGLRRSIVDEWGAMPSRLSCYERSSCRVPTRCGADRDRFALRLSLPPVKVARSSGSSSVVRRMRHTDGMSLRMPCPRAEMPRGSS